MTAETPGKCSDSLVPPAFDTVLTGTHLISGIWAAGQPERTFGSSSVRTAVVATDLILAAVHLTSAVYGYSSASSCRNARMREYDVDRAEGLSSTKLAAENEARERERAIVDTRRRNAFWSAWLPGHEATACPDALALLTSDSACTGASCRAPLFLSSGYLKSCQVDADARAALSSPRHLWKEAAGTKTSPCLEATFHALEQPANAPALPERCAGEGKTEAAFRDSVRRRPAEPGPAAPGKDN